jgi:hypothetical protein
MYNTGIEMTVFWNVAPCILEETDRRFSSRRDEAVSTSEKSVNIFSLSHPRTIPM